VPWQPHQSAVYSTLGLLDAPLQRHCFCLGRRAQVFIALQLAPDEGSLKCLNNHARAADCRLPYTLTMSKFLQTVLAWLLAVALPIQGYAAPAMLICVPAHHQSTTVHDHVAHDRDVGSANLAESVSPHGDANGSTDTSLVPHAKAVKSAHAGKCSACASCCNAAAVTSSVLAVEVIPQHGPVVAMIPACNAVDAIGGLERPPRTVTA